MDRTIVNKGQIPLETDILNTNKFAMIGLAKFAAAVLGTSTYINGLNCSPATGLNVSISAGEIYSLQNVDGTAYSSLAADTAHQILKQGISLDSVSLSCPAPAALGTSINYLIQATYQDVDSNPVVLQYYNPVNPTLPFSGKNNDGVSQSTVRKGACIVSVKAGVAATTGSQVTPSVDAGYVGLYVVSVPYGLSAITSTNISILSGAPFLTETLPQKISKATADTLYVSSAQVQALIEQYAGQSVTLSGSSNVFTGTLTHAISSNSALGEPVVVKFPSAITGAATINLGGGVTALVDAQGNAFSATNTVPAGNSIVQYDPVISKYRVLGIGGIDQVARNAAAAAQAAIPTKLSQLANDPGFITQDTTARNAAAAAQTTANAALPKSTKLGLGITGETWNSVSRAFNTTYYNYNSYPIMVSATSSCSSGSQIYSYVNGQQVTFWQWQFNGCGSYGGAILIVPPGASYQLNSGQGVQNWVELY